MKVKMQRKIKTHVCTQTLEEASGQPPKKKAKINTPAGMVLQATQQFTTAVELLTEVTKTLQPATTPPVRTRAQARAAASKTGSADRFKKPAAKPTSDTPKMTSKSESG